MAMIHGKIILIAEALFAVLLTIWQPFFGIVASVCGAVYYVSMLKINVVDKKHEGSWKKYIKSFFIND